MISINFNHIKSLRDVHAMGRRVSRYQISWDTVQLTNEPGGHLSIIFSPPSSPFSWLGFHSLPTALIGWPRAWESLLRGKLPNNDGLAYYPTQWAHHQACSCSVATAENQNPAETPKEIIPDCGDVCHPVRQRIHAVGDDGEDDIWKQNHSPSQPREEIMMALLNNWVEALWPHRSCGAAFLNLPFFTGFFKKYTAVWSPTVNVFRCLLGIPGWRVDVPRETTRGPARARPGDVRSERPKHEKREIIKFNNNSLHTIRWHFEAPAGKRCTAREGVTTEQKWPYLHQGAISRLLIETPLSSQTGGPNTQWATVGTDAA